jgi:UDP-N-acetylglucosamine 2-epimerase (non-hydrolysing)
MSKIFFENFNIKPEIFLNIGKGSQGLQTGKMLIEVEKHLMKKNPILTLIEGDTNSALAGAIASSKLNILVGHIEAGCRSYEFNMSEEINRRLIDHCSDLLFAPTKTAFENLKKEGLSKKAYLVGSTLTDVCTRIVESLSSQDEIIMEKIGLNKNEIYLLVTIHRRVNINNKKALSEIIETINSISTKTVFPIHPHTYKKIEEFALLKKMKTNKNLIVTEPLGYRPFLFLLKNARLVVTDSGGIQEEASIVNTPCITVRKKTEWPETVEAGKNILTGPGKNAILKNANKIIRDKDFYEQMRRKKSPFKSGAGINIVKEIQEFLS